MLSYLSYMTKILAFLWAMFIPCLATYAQDEVTNVVGEAPNDSVDVSPMAKAAAATLNELDLNGDGILNACDIVEIVRFVKGQPSSKFQKSKADFNSDGVVDLEDAKLLSSALTGGEIPTPTTLPTSNVTVLRGDSVTDPVGPQ